MTEEKRYPDLHIRSKNELSKRISNSKLPQKRALTLINDCLCNKDRYWTDSQKSEAEKHKWVRSAKGRPLGYLHQRINGAILCSNDRLLPYNIYGGISKSNTKKAVFHLLGNTGRRSMLKMDLSTFYEQISAQRIYDLFLYKFRCPHNVARIFTDICCINKGPKSCPESQRVLARGFATSGRLAIWSNLDAFIRIDRIVKRKLKHKDVRVAFYVDDIIITASNMSIPEWQDLYRKIVEILEKSDRNQRLVLNNDKTRIVYYENIGYTIQGKELGYMPYEVLGVKMNRKTLDVGEECMSKITVLKNRKFKTDKEKEMFKSLIRYRNYIRR